MEKLVLEVTTREVLGKKVKGLRKVGMLPAVIYFHGHESIPITLDYKEFARMYKKAGESSLVEIKISGEKKPHTVLIAGADRDVVTNKILHADFREVAMNEELTTMIPIVLVGENNIEGTGDLMLVHMIDEVEVTCLPGNLPHAIEVDITKLEAQDDQITFGELELPKDVVFALDAEAVLIKVDSSAMPDEVEETTASEEELVAGLEATKEKASEAESE